MNEVELQTYYHEVINLLWYRINKRPKQPKKVTVRDFEIFTEVVLRGAKMTEIAEEYNLSKTRISQIIKNYLRICNNITEKSTCRFY
jgi:DNA-directed RNA polymerase specialized sigma subunit